METLSDELLVHTFHFVGWAEVATSAVLVCRRWHDVGRDDALWRSFFLSHWPSFSPPEQKDDQAKREWRDRFREQRDEVEWWRRSYVPARAAGKDCDDDQERVQLPPTHIDDLASTGLGLADNKEFKVIVMGSAGVGKSTLVLWLIAGRFIEEYDPTIEDTYRKQLGLDGKLILLEILDTVQEFSVMRDSDVRSGDAFVLVYSATSTRTFQALSEYYDQINKANDNALSPIVLVENKIDLVDERQVVTKAGEMAAKALGCLFVTASAKKGERVEDVFVGAVKLCLAVRAEHDRVAKLFKKGDRKKKKKMKKKNCLLS